MVQSLHYPCPRTCTSSSSVPGARGSISRPSTKEPLLEEMTTWTSLLCPKSHTCTRRRRRRRRRRRGGADSESEEGIAGIKRGCEMHIQSIHASIKFSRVPFCQRWGLSGGFKGLGQIKNTLVAIAHPWLAEGKQRPYAIQHASLITQRLQLCSHCSYKASDLSDVRSIFQTLLCAPWTMWTSCSDSQP